MKTAAVISILLFVLLLSPINAQEPAQEGTSEQDRARSDYLFQFANYNDAHRVYATAKEAYQQFGTIAAQQEAISKTKSVLFLRAEVIRTHLQLVKLVLRDQIYLDGGLREAQVGKIEATQAFLNTHKSNIERVNSTFEVNAESLRLEREAEAVEDLSYETLIFILLGNVQEFETRTRLMLESIVARAGEDGDIQQGASEVRRRLTTVRVTIDRVTDSLLNAEAKKPGKMESVYLESRKPIREAKAELQAAAQLVFEMSGSVVQ